MTGDPAQRQDEPDGGDGGGGDVLVDARGLRCPLPVLRLAAAVRGMPAGATATVLASDPAVEHDVPAWCAMRGHEVLRSSGTDGNWSITVRLGPRTGGPPAS